MPVDAASIDRVIAQEEAAQGSRSPLEGMGAYMVSLGQEYGIDPGVVLGIEMKENSLGTVPDAIVPYNNFGGNTCGASGITTSTGCTSAAGRSWDVFPTVQAGIEGIFQTLNSSTYRPPATSGSLGDVMNIYSPPYENPDFWPTFASVGQQLGETLGPSSPVYTGPGTGIGAAAASAAGGANYAALQQVMAQYGQGLKRAGIGIGAVALLMLGAIAL